MHRSAWSGAAVDAAGLLSSLLTMLNIDAFTGQLYRDVVLNDSGPPLPVLVLFVVVFLASLYGVVGAKGASKAKGSE